MRNLELLEDALNSIRRLNKELDERAEFEAKLISIINTQAERIKELESKQQ